MGSGIVKDSAMENILKASLLVIYPALGLAAIIGFSVVGGAAAGRCSAASRVFVVITFLCWLAKKAYWFYERRAQRLPAFSLSSRGREMVGKVCALRRLSPVLAVLWFSSSSPACRAL